MEDAAGHTGEAARAGPVRNGLRVVGVVLLLGLLIRLLVGGGEPLTAGRPAPVTRGQTLDGGAFDLAEWRGQPVFVNVWATWCGPCLMELPELAEAARRHPEVRFVGLVADSPRADVDVVVARFGLPYPNLPIDRATQGAWNANALPSSFLIGKDGNIVTSASGALDGESVDAAIARLK